MYMVGLQRVFTPFGYSLVILVFECIFSIQMYMYIHFACTEIEYMKAMKWLKKNLAPCYQLSTTVEY